MRATIRSVGGVPFVAGVRAVDGVGDAVAERLGLRVAPAGRSGRYRDLLTAMAANDLVDHVAARWDGSARMYTFLRTDSCGLCEHPGCAVRPVRGSELCAVHLERFRESGVVQERAWALSQPADELSAGRDGTILAEPEPCVFVDRTGRRCLRPSVGSGWCETHHQGARRHIASGGDVADYWARAVAYERPASCAVGTCERASIRPGANLCLTHYYRWCHHERDGSQDFAAWERLQQPPDATMLDVWFGDLDDLATAEILLGMALWRDRRVRPSIVVRIVTDLRRDHRTSLGALAASSKEAAGLASAWAPAIDLLLADPQDEWDKGVVRLGAIDEQRSNTQLRFEQIVLGWLREATRTLVRSEFNRLSNSTLADHVRTASRLSVFLQTLGPRAEDPARLRRQDMDAFVAYLDDERTLSEQKALGVVYTTKTILDRFRYFDLVPLLSTTFVVRPEHFRKVPVKANVAGDRAMFDATFRLLTGNDDLFGPAALDLLRSVPNETKAGRMAGAVGDMAVTAVLCAANWGRRVEELLSLPADRIRIEDGGAASIYYDNFKSGRLAVWLPIDARQATTMNQWQAVLQERFPLTPPDRLRLFPSTRKNGRGEEPVAGPTFARWFRIWVRLLELAILVGHVANETSATPAQIARLPRNALADGHLTISGRTHALPGALAAALHAFEREIDRPKGPRPRPVGTLDDPLFECPITETAGGPRATLDLARLDPLGPDWPTVAAAYPAPGLPGANGGLQVVPEHTVEFRRFRHTYLQHLVDSGANIFLVQELADHKDVSTTIGAYVRTRMEELAAAVTTMAEHRINRFGTRMDPDRLPLPSGHDVVTNSCGNPQVLSFQKEGCDQGRLCYRCDFFSADPSNLPEITSEIRTLRASIQRFEDQDEAPRAAVLREDLAGWIELRQRIEDHVASLPADQRRRLTEACEVIRACRVHARTGGISLTHITP